MLNYYKNRRAGGQYENQTVMSNLLLSVCLSLLSNRLIRGLHMREREYSVELSFLNAPVKVSHCKKTEKY